MPLTYFSCFLLIYLKHDCCISYRLIFGTLYPRTPHIKLLNQRCERICKYSSDIFPSVELVNLIVYCLLIPVNCFKTGEMDDVLDIFALFLLQLKWLLISFCAGEYNVPLLSSYPFVRSYSFLFLLMHVGGNPAWHMSVWLSFIAFEGSHSTMNSNRLCGVVTFPVHKGIQCAV